MSEVPASRSTLGLVRAGTELQTLHAFRIIRMLKLLRVVRAARVFARWQTKNSIPYAKQSIAVFILIFLFLCHFFACLWLLVGRVERDLEQAAITASHRIAPHRIASHRIASHQIA